jgi:predicted nucleic acid-binding protein
MVLADTSVWVAHFRGESAALGPLLAEGGVMCHELVIGELACGRLSNRTAGEILTLLKALPSAGRVEHDEALAFLEASKLAGTGVGWIDVHLLASAVLEAATLLTLDEPLRAAARRIGVPHGPG